MQRYANLQITNLDVIYADNDKATAELLLPSPPNCSWPSNKNLLRWDYICIYLYRVNFTLLNSLCLAPTNKTIVLKNYIKTAQKLLSFFSIKSYIHLRDLNHIILSLLGIFKTQDTQWKIPSCTQIKQTWLYKTLVQTNY